MNPQILFQAFDLEVVDYLLKPISFERFLQAVNKVYDSLTKTIPTETLKPQAEHKRDYIFVKTEYRIQRIDFKDVLFIEGMKEYLRIHTKNEKIMTLMSFKKMEELLPRDNFARVHKSYIIAINKIDSVERNRIKIKNNSIPVGDTYKKRFYELL